MTISTILRLGRVSNLPTVWSNALAGAALAGGDGEYVTILMVALALSFFYEGGMWLNDAFDAEVDARERTDRPIPRGEISRNTVLAIGFALLAAGVVAAFMIRPVAGWAGIALASAVIVYDWLHKRTVLSPVIMGATRFLCYALAALAVGSFDGRALFGAVGLFAHVVGLTYAARQEAYDRLGRAWPLAVLAVPIAIALHNTAAAPEAIPFFITLVAVVAFALRLLIRRRTGDVPRAVVTLIAGISLYDATLIAAAGQITLALFAALGFALTLLLQHIAPGT